MKTIKQVLAGFLKPSLKRWAAAGMVVFLPGAASAQQIIPAIPTGGPDSSVLIFGDYLRLPVTAPSSQTLQGIFTEALSRDLLIGLMLAICVAMVIGASYLWRENVDHLRADAERQKQRETLDLL